MNPTPEYLQEPEAAFEKAADRLLTLAWSAGEAKFRAVFPQAYKDYLAASNRYRFALIEYAKTIRNLEVGEVYTKKADDLFIQTPFLVSAVLGYRKRHKP